MKRTMLGTTAAGAVLAVSLSACHSGGTSVSGAQASARAAALATSSAAVQAKKNLAAISAKCGTTFATGQIAAAKDLTTHTGREKLWAKCGVPQAKRADVEAKALDAAEKAHLFTGGHTARATYFAVTLPNIIEAAQA